MQLPSEDLLKALKYYTPHYHKEILAKEIFERINKLHININPGKIKVSPLYKDHLKAELDTINYFILEISSKLNKQLSFLPRGRKTIRDVISFYNTELLQIEKLKLKRESYSLRRKDDFKDFMKKIAKLSTHFWIKRELDRYKLEDTLKYIYILTLLFNVYKLIRGKKRFKSEKGFMRRVYKELWLGYDSFINTDFFEKGIKRELEEKYFINIKFRPDRVFNPNLELKPINVFDSEWLLNKFVIPLKTLK